MTARFPDPHHINGFYLGQFFGLLGWHSRSDAAPHSLEGFDPEEPGDIEHLTGLLTPCLDMLTEAQDAALARTWAYALSEFDDRDLGWFLLGRLPEVPEHPRDFLSVVAKRLYPQGLPEVDPQMRRLDVPNESLFDLA